MAEILCGLDFDNTIVRYDEIFHRVARQEGLVPADVRRSKDGVRDYLRARGREAAWTELQGRVYGARMLDAPAFPGVLDCVRRARSRGVRFCIVSHRTRHPVLGPPHDLHGAAFAWLDANGFFDEARTGLERRDVYLELSREDKLARIAALGCDYFVDDLPELVTDPDFPAHVHAILFDPNDQYGVHGGVDRARSWGDVERRLVAVACADRR
jgi:hypothetical protein